MTYKRNWFLGLEEFRLLIDRSVAVNAAMKSGLKDDIKAILRQSQNGSSECRDEKRTESIVVEFHHESFLRSSECRDEKRTER